jgi:hypothetical protein
MFVAGKTKNVPELKAHDGVGPPSTGGANSGGWNCNAHTKRVRRMRREVKRKIGF